MPYRQKGAVPNVVWVCTLHSITIQNMRFRNLFGGGFLYGSLYANVANFCSETLFANCCTVSIYLQIADSAQTEYCTTFPLSVRPFVTGMTSHISHIYKGINAMLIIRGPSKPCIFWIKIILAIFLAKTRPDKTIFSALTNLTIDFDFELSKIQMLNPQCLLCLVFALFSNKNMTPGKNSTTAGRDKSHV